MATRPVNQWTRNDFRVIPYNYISVCTPTRSRVMLKLFQRGHLASPLMKAMNATLPACRTSRCHCRVPSKRATLCLLCRHRMARVSGGRSTGNRNAAGNPNNAGNGRKGASKKAAGTRSGLKRSAKYCLVVKKKWLDLILAGSKDWEIRRCSAQRRGWFHFAESGSGGKLVGRARLVDCLNSSKASFMKNFHRHRVPSWAQVKYKSVYAWVLKEAERFERPFKYDHTQGAVIWVKVL